MISFSGCIPCGSWTWSVIMPSHIKALLGSCVVIPCTFDYYENPPSNPDRVVWYQYASHSYPLVYDDWYSAKVIPEFIGKTSRVKTFSGGKECTLKISKVTWMHHRQRIYPWIDPEHVGRRTYRFFDKTVTIEVTGKLPLSERKYTLWGWCFCSPNIPLLFHLFFLERQGRDTRNYDLWRNEGRTNCDSPVLSRSQLFFRTARSNSKYTTATPQNQHIPNGHGHI